MRAEAEAMLDQLTQERAGIEAGIKQMEAGIADYRSGLHRIEGALAALNKLLEEPKEIENLDTFLDENEGPHCPPVIDDDCDDDCDLDEGDTD